MNYFLTDEVSQSLCDEDGDKTIDFSRKETVTVEDDGIVEFFGTDQFYTFKATVAKPLVQKYVIDEEIVRLKKTEKELTKATWQIDTLPWTRTHPDAKEVEHTDQIRGFWRSPSYDDGQTAIGYLPANDEEMMSFVAENPSVSIGFTPQIEWTINNDVGYEGIQREMLYDHIASVQHGRCSRENGCGLMADEADCNHIRTSSDEEVASDVPCCTRNEITPLDEAAEERLSTIADDGAVTDSTTNTTMCEDNPFDGVVDGMSVEAVRRRNDSVDEELTELNEEVESLNDEKSDLEATVDEKDERIESLESTVDEKDERIDALAEEVISYVDDAFEEAVDELTGFTDKWDEETLQEQYDDAEGVEAKRAVVDDVAEKIELVEDLSTSVTTVGDSKNDDGGVDDGDDVVETVVDAKTDEGTFDLRGDA